MVSKGWAQSHSSWSSLTCTLQTDDITLNKLALISKIKPDGSMKHRLVWDLLRSSVNSVVQQGERVVLPRVLDLVNDAWDLSQSSHPKDLHLFGTDISDAFHQVPLSPDEWRFTAASFQEVFMCSKFWYSDLPVHPRCGGVLHPSQAEAPQPYVRTWAFACKCTWMTQCSWLWGPCPPHHAPSPRHCFGSTS